MRWRFVPQDGEQRLSDEALKSSPPNFLEQALINRVERGSVRYDMMLTIGLPGDPENDPAFAWPENRKRRKVGTLTISYAMPQKGAACEKSTTIR